MMDIFYTDPLYALIISNAVLIFGAAITLLRFERQVMCNRSFWDSPTGASVQSNLHPDAVLAGFLDRRLAMLHQQIDELAGKIATAAATQPADMPFEHAVRMAQHGASADELTRICGLNKAEARLMWRLHAKQHPAESPSAH